MATDELLKQGIAALRGGHKVEARNLLMQVLEQDERNEMAWLWLSGAVDTDEERRICLENVLAINPNNGMARRGLESLIAKEGVRSLSAVSSPTPRAQPAAIAREQPAQIPVEVSAPDMTRREKPKHTPRSREATKQRTRLIIGFGAVVLVLACIALAGIWWAIDSGLLQFGPVLPITIDTAQIPPTADVTLTPSPAPLITGLAADYALRSEDLPSNYDLFPVGTGLVQSIGDCPNGYAVSFKNTDLLPNPSEALVVFNAVYVCQSIDAAVGSTEGLAMAFAEASGQSVHEVPVNSFADEVAAVGFSLSDSATLPAIGYSYAFRRANVVVVIVVMGLDPMGSESGIDISNCDFFASQVLLKIERDLRH